MRLVVLQRLLVVACTVAISGLAFAQQPASPAAPASPASSATTPPAAPSPTPAAKPDSSARKAPMTSAEKKCASAERKLDKEKQYLKGIEDNIASKERALKACGTKSLCAKFEADRNAMEKLKVRHEKRIERFAANRDVACIDKAG
jgi:hypothetical protein